MKMKMTANYEKVHKRLVKEAKKKPVCYVVQFDWFPDESEKIWSVTAPELRNTGASASVRVQITGSPSKAAVLYGLEKIADWVCLAFPAIGLLPHRDRAESTRQSAPGPIPVDKFSERSTVETRHFREYRQSEGGCKGWPARRNGTTL